MPTTFFQASEGYEKTAYPSGISGCSGIKQLLFPGLPVSGYANNADTHGIVRRKDAGHNETVHEKSSFQKGFSKIYTGTLSHVKKAFASSPDAAEKMGALTAA